MESKKFKWKVSRLKKEITVVDPFDSEEVQKCFELFQNSTVTFT